MRLEIGGVHILYRAIESLEVAEVRDKPAVKVRTVSGRELLQQVDTEEQALKLIERVLYQISVHDSI